MSKESCPFVNPRESFEKFETLNVMSCFPDLATGPGYHTAYRFTSSFWMIVKFSTLCLSANTTPPVAVVDQPINVWFVLANPLAVKFLA